jgi:hypothetical protein
MTKTDPLRSIPILPISPITLVCPLCGAIPGKVCHTLSGVELEIIHVARVEAAAYADAAANKQKSYRQRGV